MLARIAMVLAAVSAAWVACGEVQPPPPIERKPAPPTTPTTPTTPAPEARVRARAAGEPVRVFFTTRSMGFRHGVLPEARQILGDADAARGWVEFEITDEIEPIAGHNLAGKLGTIDVLMLYTTGRLPLDTAVLARWVEGGGAVVGVHSATDTLSDDGAYVRLIGGVFDGHPWNEEVTLRIDDARHAAMLPFTREAMETVPLTFRFADEIYQFKSLAPDRRVVMSLSPGNPKMEEGREYPLAWTREPGKGRVFYTALGHRPEVWRDARFVEHVLNGIRWAARAEASK
ncbi:MAG: ThuA domain-containing protein [Phycisphaerae bacterium]|nr:ThuA domain-containing protein [Phycisphaerae bacterium]